ncbi:MAG TPA: hypothetical protein PL110_08100 [Candidatus Eremiobacteraeota bacterium]|nr:MAG: hypothetical protein BWY64_02000 [bacterium ADurb.Bin363]HPZ08061.1 hypothetical protein [Candidatus Eremiobacteraeota bacterium]
MAGTWVGCQAGYAIAGPIGGVAGIVIGSTAGFMIGSTVGREIGRGIGKALTPEKKENKSKEI